MLTDGFVPIGDSLTQTKSNIDMIKKECLKVNRDPDDIEIAAIVYPNIEGLSSDDYIKPTESKIEWQRQQKKSRHLLNGNVEQVGDDLRQIREIGVNLAILNYNRSPISNNIDSIIDVTRQIDKLVR